MTPFFKHDCDSCVLIGKNAPKPEDVYYCPSEGSIVIRCSSEEPDYKSFPVSVARRVGSHDNEWTLPVMLVDAYFAGVEEGRRRL